MEKDMFKLVSFDPNEIRAAILQCQKKTREIDAERDRVVQLENTYRQLLRLNGLEESQSPVAAPTTLHHEAVNLAASIRQADSPPKIADVAVEAMRNNGGRMHGKKILEAVQLRGLMANSKFPMTQLAATLRRDGRVQKDGRARNTWRLRPGI